MITMNSRIKDIYRNPVGHDIIAKVLLQIGMPNIMVENPFVMNLKLKTLKPFTKNILDDDFFDAFITLMNSEKSLPYVSTFPISEKWWKEAVFYQIYPRTFMDGNHDGIGDLKGMISKLDYLKDLGIDAIWLSPIYDSPMDDNGYDIRDYEKINPDFGTMDDFDALLEGVHQRGMKLIMDLVVNHTSDEHAWFKEALEDPDSKYREYYFIRDHSEEAPNNWTSFFSGSAWTQVGERNEWAMHLFSKKQMDLNWDNPDVRKDVEDMVNRWLDKGVDGFRLDVINYISKANGLPMGNESVGQLMGYTGIEHYYYGPHLHEYLKELNRNCFRPHDAFSVGETPGLGMQMAQLVTGEERRELDMIFSFDHLETPGHVRFEKYDYDLNYFRDYMINWMENYGNNCWMSLFYNNHDNPRMVSKIDSSHQYVKEIETLLLVLQMTLKGTPFIYQGDEMGLTNIAYRSIDELNDVESRNAYRALLDEGKSEEEAWEIIYAGTRDHARMLLPWNDFDIPAHLKQTINEEMTQLYKELIALRKNNKALIYGDFKVLNRKKDRFVYERSLNGISFIIDANLSSSTVKAYKLKDDYQKIFGDNDDPMLNAYETRIYKKTV